MKTLTSKSVTLGFVAVLAIVTGVVLNGFADQTGKVFATPQAAVSALQEAVATTNRAGFALLFGSDADRLANPDTVQGANDLAEFARAFDETNRLVGDSNGKMILEVGADAWPFPIPLIKGAEGWRFDTDAGREEIVNRRIGRNEITVLRVMRGYVEAQRDYASRDRDGDQVLEYATRLLSSPGKTDGLYWPPDVNGEISPLGPFVARAQVVGYFGDLKDHSPAARPFFGYFFKMLARQGKHAPGGKYDYVINGNMIGGFGLVAWPAEYGTSGIMTFVVNQQGRVFQKDLGPNTQKTVRKMTAYDPDSSWAASAD